MRWSDERILTTHTGSLPRPPELTRLYVRRARGEAIDRAELDRVGKAALRRIVDKQIEAGIDIGNNGATPSLAPRLTDILDAIERIRAEMGACRSRPSRPIGASAGWWSAASKSFPRQAAV
jgi:hypothetical protein